VATPGHLEPLLLKDHVYIVALTLDLQGSPYSVIEFLYHSSTTKLILSLILLKESYPSFKAYNYAGTSLAL
jgi:hypothetical protein